MDRGDRHASGLDELKQGEDFPILKEMLATACVKAGHRASALDLLGEALGGSGTKRGSATGMRSYIEKSSRRGPPSLVACATGRSGSSFHSTLSVAREQNARSLELRAAMSLATLERSRTGKRLPRVRGSSLCTSGS